MKIKKSVLVEALKVLGKVVSQTSPVEVLRSVRFLGVGEQVWLTATDGVESVTVEVAGDAGDMEDFAVEYKALRELIRSTRGGEVEVTGKRLDWPEMETVPDDAVTVELSPDFGKLLALAAPVVNLREARLALRGINLSRDGVTATNGKELLNLPCPLKIPEDMTLPFPLALLTAQPEGAGTLHVWRSRNERLFRIVIGDFLWQGKALPGNFPDWKQVVPADKTLDYQIEIHEPERVIAFLKTVPDSPPFHAIELNVVPGGVAMIPNNFPDMELRLEATVIGAQPRAVLALNKYVLLQMLQQDYTRCRFTYSPNINPKRRQTKWKTSKTKLCQPRRRRSPQTMNPEPIRWMNSATPSIHSGINSNSPWTNRLCWCARSRRFSLRKSRKSGISFRQNAPSNGSEWQSDRCIININRKGRRCDASGSFHIWRIGLC